MYVRDILSLIVYSHNITNPNKKEIVSKTNANKNLLFLTFEIFF